MVSGSTAQEMAVDLQNDQAKKSIPNIQEELDGLNGRRMTRCSRGKEKKTA